jgi:hypothetical protein
MEVASAKKNSAIVLPVTLFLVAVCLRLPFTSRLLYHHDSVNFALAIEHFDLRLHQPHPPGYLLYVMLGRLLNLFVHDCNAALIAISVLFTSLTVVIIYFLGSDIYDRRTGVIAGTLALTSPNLWFHGEIALTYGLEAFFSATIGWTCWHLCRGRRELIFASAILLGIAGGFRQNTCLFLLPLWLLSVRRLPLRRVLTALALVAGMCGMWLMITVGMTGGIENYAAAFTSLWDSNTGHNSVFEKGWESAWLFGKTLMTFSLYTLGAGVAGLILGLYGILRSRDWGNVSRERMWFYAAWVLPAYLFYQLIFIHPANPGYFLILLPPLLLFCARGILKAVEVVGTGSGTPAAVVTGVIVMANAAMFLVTDLPVSANIIDRHDRDLTAMVRELRALDHSTTAIVLRPSIFYGFRMFMYYLPQHLVCDADVASQTFSGRQHRTVLSRTLALPPHLINAATITFASQCSTGRRIPTLKGVWVVSGPRDQIVKSFRQR